MASRLSRTAAIVAASSVAAGAAYAAGTQSDGAAVAAKRGPSQQAPDERRADRIADLARELGVEASALRTALEELRGELRPDGEGDMLAALAKELGTTEEKVREAFEANRGRRPGPAQMRRVARALGVTTAKLRAAMRDAHEAAGAARRAEHAAELARALGVEQSAVEQALEDVRKAKEAEIEARRDQFAEKLAAKLGVSADKVKEVFGDRARFGGPGMRHRRHHGGGPGGPGFGPMGPPPGEHG